MKNKKEINRCIAYEDLDALKPLLVDAKHIEYAFLQSRNITEKMRRVNPITHFLIENFKDQMKLSRIIDMYCRKNEVVPEIEYPLYDITSFFEDR